MKLSFLGASILLHGLLLAVLVRVTAAPRSDSRRDEPLDLSFVEIIEDSASETEAEAPLPAPAEDLPALEASAPPPSPDGSEHVPQGDSPPDLPPELPSAAEQGAAADAPRAEVELPRVISLPVAINRITPKYPRSARRKGHAGRVLVEAEIDAAGGVTQVRVVESSGFPELDQAAVSAVRQAEFQPARNGDQSVSGLIRLPIDFRFRLNPDF